MDTYESGYGIYDHSQHAVDNSRPLALVAMHWSESNTDQSTLHERIEQFKERQVFQIFGIGLIEFLNLPRDYCIKILEVCGKSQMREGKIAQDLQNRYDNLERKP